MTAVVITRQGWGVAVSFANRKEAATSPIFGMSDALMDCSYSVLDQYNHMEWPRLMRMVGLEPKHVEATLLRGPGRERDKIREAWAEQIWQRILERAVPPEKYLEMSKMAKRDTSSDLTESQTETTVASGDAAAAAPMPEPKGRKPKATAAAAAAAAAPSAAAAAAAPSADGTVEAATPAEEIKKRGFDPKAVIVLKAEKNPKREGSIAHSVFEHYSKVKTVEEFVAAVDGLPNAKAGTGITNLRYDIGKGFIELKAAA